MFCRDAQETNIQVRMGSINANGPDPDAVVDGVEKVIVHPNWNLVRMTSDVALLKLHSPVTFTDTILPVCLPSTNVDLDMFKVCGVSTGFGQTSYNGLYYSPRLWFVVL